MSPADDLPYKSIVAVLATMHGKERVIAPVLKEGLGLVVGLATGVDSDTFGTFSRDVERAGSQLDAARAKIAAGFVYAPYARVGIASEGSFGPHPYIPFLTLGRELVLLIDRERGVELTGRFASPETNYGHAVVSDMDAAASFAERSKFPEHGLIVMGCVDEKPAPGSALFKEIVDHTALEKAVGHVVAKCGAAFVEAEMRAHRNPPGCARSDARRVTWFAGFAVNAQSAHTPDSMSPNALPVSLANGAGDRPM